MITIDDAIAFASKQLGREEIELVGPRVYWSLCSDRQYAIWLARIGAKGTLQAIGAKFGGRHHTTVLYSLRQVERKRAADPEVLQLTDRWLAELRGGTG